MLALACPGPELAALVLVRIKHRGSDALPRYSTVENPPIHQSLHPVAAPQMSQLGLAKYTRTTQRLT